MSGGLLEYLGYGSNDLYLTGAPQVSFFEKVNRRYVNFSKQTFKLVVGNMNFGDTLRFTVPKCGALVGKTSLQFIVPEMSIQKTDLDEYYVAPTIYNPTDPPDSYIQEIAAAYDTIKSFVKHNALYYRAATKNLAVKNQTVAEYVAAIIAAANDVPVQIISDYHAALIVAVQLENYLERNENIGFLNLTTTYIMLMLQYTYYQPVGNGTAVASDFTIDFIYQLCVTTYRNSQLVYQYFYDYYLQYQRLTHEHLTSNAKFAWMPNLGHNMLATVDVMIGDEKIDGNTSQFLDLRKQITGSANKTEAYDRMLGNVPAMTTYDATAKPQYICDVPLHYWYTASSALANPLIALQYSDLIHNIKLKSLEECAYVETVTENQLSLSDVWENKGLNIGVNIILEFYFLSKLEIKRFAQSQHEYLALTSRQYQTFQVNNAEAEIILDGSGITQDMWWFATRDQVPDKLNYATYLGNNPIDNSVLTTMGEVVVFDENSMQTNVINPLDYYGTSPTAGINVHSFALYPQELNPSGVMNMNNVFDPVLQITLKPEAFYYRLSEVNRDIMPGSDEDTLELTTVTLTCITRNLAIIKYMHGMAGIYVH